MTLNTYKKIMLIIEFLLVVTSLLSISSTLSALLLADISVASGGVRGEPFEVLVTVVGVKENCGQEVKITVAYKSETLIYVSVTNDYYNKE